MPSPHPILRRLAYPMIVTLVAVLAAIALLAYSTDSAATEIVATTTKTTITPPPLTPAQRLARRRAATNAHIIRRCNHFYYDGRSPDIFVCRALLKAFQRYAGMRQRRWAAYPATLKLLRRESGYAHRAINPSSGACGLGQMLPCHKYGGQSCWPGLQQQADCFARYLVGRYHTPCRAWQFWLDHSWY